ncbi:MAG: glycosyltransferase family 39 protein [Candidatus Chisholmbacteria bacterium]|nr:glycosyltransferase family 39 protein [Candidatus Chisholmbacteria bacterium]
MTPVILLLNPPPVFTDQTLTTFDATVLQWIPPQRGTYNRFTHPLSERQFRWGRLEWSVHLIRFLTSIFSFISIILIFKTSQKLFGTTSNLPYAISLFIGFHPKFIHRSASIINLPLLTLAFSLFFYFALTRPPSYKTAFLLGLAAGLALVTKITGLNLGLFFLIYLLLFVRGWSNRIAQSLSFLTGGLLVSGWELVRNFLLYHDPLALNQAFRIAADLHPGKVQPLFGGAPNYWFAVLETTFLTFWDGFGWEVTLVGWWFIYIALGLSVLALVSFWRVLSLSQPQLRRQLSFLVVCLAPFTANFIRINTQFFTPQGKDFLPMIFPIATIFVLGLKRWWPKELKLIPTTLLLFVAGVLLLLLVVVPTTLGDQNISPQIYQQSLTADPIKQFLVTLWRTRFLQSR